MRSKDNSPNQHKNPENRSATLRYIFVIGTLAIILGLASLTSPTPIDIEATTLASTYAIPNQTPSQTPTNSSDIYLPTAQYVQEKQNQKIITTATYLATHPDDIDPSLKSSSVKIWPGYKADVPMGDTSCSGGVLDVKKVSNNTDSIYDYQVITTTITMLHCLQDQANNALYDYFILQSINGDYIEANLVDYDILDGIPNADADYPVILKTTSPSYYLEPLEQLDNDLVLGTESNWGYSTYNYCGFPAAIMTGSAKVLNDLYCQTLTYAGMVDGLVSLKFQLGDGGSGGLIQKKDEIVCIGSDRLLYRTDDISYCAPVPPDGQEKADELMNR